MFLSPTSITRFNQGQGRTKAIVVDNNDKEGHKDKKPLQRVKVRIPGDHRNVPDSDLPWFTPHPSLHANGGQGQVGSVKIPPKGSEILVSFDGDDPHNGAYMGSPTTEKSMSSHPHITHDDYPHVSGEADSSGNLTETNTKRDTQTTTHKSGTRVHIGADGSVSISGAKDYTIGSGGNIKIVASGSVEIGAGGNIILNGAIIHLNPGGGSSPAGTSPRQRPDLGDPSGQTKL